MRRARDSGRPAAATRKLVLELPCRIRHFGPLNQQPVGSVEQLELVRFRRSSHAT